VLAMKEINKDTLKIAANKLMFDMSDEEYEVLLKEFETLTKQLEVISTIDGINDAVPMTFPFDVANDFLREDIPCIPLDKDEALKNAKDVVDGQIRLPKVVG
jgi:aspartyl/glutamyl-tRNA(Asn/Gln) amidotransferase C subunit